VFDVRKTFSGAPEGGLPYLLLLLATMFAVGCGIFTYYGGVFEANIVIYAIWLTGCWAFIWSLGWLVSSFTKTGAGTAKKSHIAATVIIGLLPWPFLAIVTSTTHSDWLDIFRVYPYAGYLYDSASIETVIFMIFELWIAAAALTFWAESRRKNVVSLYKRALHAG
jgi:hypothetical protein